MGSLLDKTEPPEPPEPPQWRIELKCASANLNGSTTLHGNNKDVVSGQVTPQNIRFNLLKDCFESNYVIFCKKLHFRR